MKKIIFLLISATLLVACEKQIDIDIEDLEQQLVVKAQNEAGSPLVVDLTYSRPVYGTFYVRNGEDYFPAVDNATVTLSIDGGATVTATRDGGTYTFAHVPQPGEQLTLNIAVPGRDPVSATATVPQQPTVVGIDTATSLNGESYGVFLQYSISFNLNDRPATEDFYSIRLRKTDTIITLHRDEEGNVLSSDTNIRKDYNWFTCSDYLIVDGTGLNVSIDDPTATNSFAGNELLFTDAKINGQSHRIILKMGDDYDYYYEDDYLKTGDTVFSHSSLMLEVTALSRDLYLYRQTMNNYDGDPLLSFFSEPMQIHSNITGGIGIFGVSSKVSCTIPYRSRHD